MRQTNCYRMTPSTVPWSDAADSHLATRALFASDLVRLIECRADAGTRCSAAPRSLYLLTSGTIALAEGPELVAGDLYWCNAPSASFTSGSNGATWYQVTALQDIGRDLSSTVIQSAELPWEQFDDPAGRPTQPVQVLLDGTVSALRTRFDPDYIAGEHWHDFDTLYFIRDGRMQFGDEGWFEQGDIRAVHGGHSYGPERPGAEGVEFVLISLGGPVALHWSDLEPPP